MPVEIHGRQYNTVAERLSAFHETFNGDAARIVTCVLSEDEKQVTVQAIVTTPRGTFMGHARSRKGSGGIEQQSDLEVAETSAVGRALAFAGFGAIESVASAEEVIVAQGRESAFSISRVRLDEPAPTSGECPKHHRAKQGREGRFYCPTKMSDGKWCDWHPPEQAMPEDGGDVPFAANEDPDFRT